VSASGWQPKTRDGSGALLYRCQFSSQAPDLRQQAIEKFVARTRAKGVSANADSLFDGVAVEALAADGTRRLAHRYQVRLRRPLQWPLPTGGATASG